MIWLSDYFYKYHNLLKSSLIIFFMDYNFPSMIKIYILLIIYTVVTSSCYTFHFRSQTLLFRYVHVHVYVYVIFISHNSTKVDGLLHFVNDYACLFITPLNITITYILFTILYTCLFILYILKIIRNYSIKLKKNNCFICIIIWYIFFMYLFS